MNAPSSPAVDHAAIAQSAEFQELVDKRRKFVLLAVGFASAWFGGFVLLASYAHDFMRHMIVPGLSVAYVLGLSQFVMVWGVTAAYLRISRRTLDPMQVKVVAVAQQSGTGAPS